MILPNGYTNSIIFSLIILALHIVTLFFLFEIKIRLEGEFSKAFTFLILGIIFGIIASVMNLLNLFLSDILMVFFATFIFIFALIIYHALHHIKEKDISRKEKNKPEKEIKSIKQSGKIRTTERVRLGPRRKILGTEEYIDMTE